MSGHDIWRVSYSEIDYTAAPGEANRVAISGQANRPRLVDKGALIFSFDDPTSATSCLGAAQSAWCSTHYVGFYLFADLGDGDDAITTSPELIGANIHAGAGNDVIDTRGGAIDEVSCGDGDDRVAADSTDQVDATCETVS